jgi:hypothetical protein
VVLEYFYQIIMNPLPPLPRDQHKTDADHLNLLAIFHFVGGGPAVLLVSVGVLLAAEPVLSSGTNVTLSIQEPMTPARFQEIVSAPGDVVPLIAPLAAAPFWTNAVATNVMTYASGKIFKEVMTVTAHTVGGQYVVFTAYSSFYQQPMQTIFGYDAKALVLTTYGLYGDGHGGNIVTEATVVYDFDKQTYTMNSSYGDGFKKTTTGSYTDTEDVTKTVVYKNGALFVTHEIVTRPVLPTK